MLVCTKHKRQLMTGVERLVGAGAGMYSSLVAGAGAGLQRCDSALSAHRPVLLLCGAAGAGAATALLVQAWLHCEEGVLAAVTRKLFKLARRLPWLEKRIQRELQEGVAHTKHYGSVLKYKMMFAFSKRKVEATLTRRTWPDCGRTPRHRWPASTSPPVCRARAGTRRRS